MLESGLPSMEQASLFIANMTGLRDSCEQGDIVCAAWKRTVGKVIASHTRAEKLVRDKLVVEVEDWLWLRNLMGMSQQIVTRLEKAIGPGIVKDLEFRVARRGPQTAQASTRSFESHDEADGISDPGLRRIYRMKRGRGIA